MIPITPKKIIIDFYEENVSTFITYIIQIPPIILIDVKDIKKTSNADLQNHKKKILTYLTSIKDKFNEKLIIFPEITMIPEMIPVLESYAVLNNAYIVAGSFYENGRNISKIITPHPTTFTQEKMNKSKYEVIDIKSNNEVVVFRNTKIGNFSVIICLDYTMTDIISQLESSVDYVIVIACNPDTKRFQNMTIADLTRLKAYIIYANSTCPIGISIPKSKYGGSGIYGPFKDQTSIIQTYFEERIINGKINLSMIRDKTDNVLIGTVHSKKEQIDNQIVPYYTKEQMDKINGEQLIKIIKNEININNQENAINICRLYVRKFENIDNEISLLLYIVLAVLYIVENNHSGKFLAVMDVIQRLLMNSTLEEMLKQNIIIFLNNKYPNQVEYVKKILNARVIKNQ